MSFTSFFAAAINKGAKLTKGPAEVAAHFDGLVAAAKVGRALDPAALDAARTAYRNLLESLPKGSARSEAERDFATEVVQAVGKEPDKKDAFMKALGADGIADSVLNAEAKAAKKGAQAADKVSQTLSALTPKTTPVEGLDASLRTLRADLGKAGLIDANAAPKPRTVKDIRGALESGQAITQAEFTKFASGLRQESLVAERGRLVTQIERATTTPDGRADAALFDRLETLRADKDYPKGKGASTNDALADLKAGRPVSDDSLTALRNHHTRPVDPPAPPAPHSDPALAPARGIVHDRINGLQPATQQIEAVTASLTQLRQDVRGAGLINDSLTATRPVNEIVHALENGSPITSRELTTFSSAVRHSSLRAEHSELVNVLQRAERNGRKTDVEKVFDRMALLRKDSDYPDPTVATSTSRTPSGIKDDLYRGRELTDSQFERARAYLVKHYQQDMNIPSSPPVMPLPAQGAMAHGINLAKTLLDRFDTGKGVGPSLSRSLEDHTGFAIPRTRYVAPIALAGAIGLTNYDYIYGSGPQPGFSIAQRLPVATFLSMDTWGNDKGQAVDLTEWALQKNPRLLQDPSSPFRQYVDALKTEDAEALARSPLSADQKEATRNLGVGVDKDSTALVAELKTQQGIDFDAARAKLQASAPLAGAPSTETLDAALSGRAPVGASDSAKGATSSAFNSMNGAEVFKNLKAARDGNLIKDGEFQSLCVAWAQSTKAPVDQDKELTATNVGTPQEVADFNTAMEEILGKDPNRRAQIVKYVTGEILGLGPR